jgi:hypothetical protein
VILAFVAGILVGLIVSIALSELAWRRHFKKIKVGGTD